MAEKIFVTILFSDFSIRLYIVLLVIIQETLNLTAMSNL